MPLCPKCDHSPWPFVLALTIAAVSAFLTWLSLGLTLTEPLYRILAGALAFAAVGTTLVHYLLTCMKRHCKHG
jgi:hypothetical protein